MSWKVKLREYLDVKDAFIEDLGNGMTFKVFHARSLQLIEIIRSIISAAEEVDHKSLNDEDRVQLEVVKFKWAIEALDIAILIRDVEIRTSKSTILTLATGAEVSDSEEIIEEYQEVVNHALTENAKLVNDILSKSAKTEKSWFHQLSPGKEILDQLSEIIEQQTLIMGSHEVLRGLTPQLIKHREYVLDYNNHRLRKIRELEKQLGEITEVIQQAPVEITREELQDLSKSIEKICLVIENEKMNLSPYESFKTDIGEYKIPIFSNGGELIYKPISFGQRMESWTENELFPKMYDVDSDITSLYDSTLIAIYNTRNKLENLLLTEQQTYAFIPTQFNDVLLKKQEGIKAYISKLDTIIHEINSLVSEEFRIEKIYNQGANFLEEKGFANISKLTNQRLWYERNLWSSIKGNVSEYLAGDNMTFLNRLKQDPYSYVAKRQIDEQDLDINSLFLKKGYLGRSFYIPRKRIHAQFAQSFEQWKEGFRGSVLVTGTYGSGKSSFLEFLPYFLNEDKVIQVSLYNIIKLNGRKHQVSENLSETIAFLGSQSINKRIVVCIDNLELWKSNDRTMYDTVRDLIEGIAKFGKRIFFVVATNHYMLSHINRLFDFDSRFATIINLDTMGQEAMTEAIVVRHNASLKEFDLEENSIITKRASKLVQKTRYNIGSAMFAWERFLENESMPEVAPPSFHKLVSEHKLMLRIVLTYKKIRDAELRKSMTSLDNNFISEEIRKLMGYKILERTIEGYLRINPFVVDEIENSLQRK